MWLNITGIVNNMVNVTFDIKGIVSDSSSIILWHKLEDINKKRLFPKFQLIPILRLLVMYDYVHWHYSIEYRVRLFSDDFSLIPLGKYINVPLDEKLKFWHFWERSL